MSNEKQVPSFFVDPTKTQETPPPPASPNANTNLNLPDFDYSKAPQLQNVDDILTLGHLEKDFDLFGFAFKIKTLNTGEMESALQSLAIMSDVSQSLKMGVALLSRSLISIQGHPLEAYYEKWIPEDQRATAPTILEKKEQIIRFLPPPVTGALLDKYKEVTQQAEESMGGFATVKK